MHKHIILVAETGCDIPAALAVEKDIFLVPMHVQMGDVTLEDGSFPPEDVCAYYDRTGKCATTSASTPYDFTKIFDELHDQYPEHQILHLAYSAVTTCSYQNAVLVSEDRPYVTSVDTKHVSVGQGAVVLAAADYLAAHPDCTIEEAAAFVTKIREQTQMCFIPKNLDYLRAGGRVSNAAAMVGNLLGLHPCIEIINGKLMAQKKYRGTLNKVVPKMIEDFTAKHTLDRSHLYLIDTPYLDEQVRALAEETAKKLGFASITWIKTGCVITCHGGPGALGMVGMCAK